MQYANQIPSQLLVDKTARKSFMSYLSRVKHGNMKDDPLYTGLWNTVSKLEDRVAIAHEWYDFAKYGFAKSVAGLGKFEEEMLSKVGPLSCMKPLRDRIDDVKHYYSMSKLPSEPIDSRAIASFISTLKGIKVHLRDYRSTILNMRTNTNSGIPYFTKRSKVIEDTLRDLSFGTDHSAAILGWRGQEAGPGKDDVKQRVVWMFDFADNIKELSFYQPAIEIWQQENINAAYLNFDMVEEKITKLFDTKGDNYVIVTDFTKFDQHFNYDMQVAAYEVIKSMITGYDGYKWLEEVFPIKYNIPIILSPDLILYGEHGMGSGSGGTNFDECCAHSCLQHEVALKHGKKLNPWSNAYGDDGYLSYDGIDVDDVIEAYTSHGQEMNADKQSADKYSAVYLRRYFHSSYRDSKGKMLGIYSTCRALGRLLFQERYFNAEMEDEYRDFTILRAWSIIENCNRHPLFDEFVKFVMRGDKFRLGLSIPGFMDKWAQEGLFNKFTQVHPDVLGYTKSLMSRTSGVKNWRIYKYLMSQR